MKGSKSSRYKNLTKLFTLDKNADDHLLRDLGDSVFLFHLHLLQVLDEAIRSGLYAHHVVMLRQILENISSFLGKGNINYVLSQIGVNDPENVANTINSLSHKDAYYYQSNLMAPAVETVLKDVFGKLLEKYKFSFNRG